MIGYLEGTILHFESDGILLKAGNIGYEVLLNPQIVERLVSRDKNENFVGLYIYYHQTERQPKPVLIGFESLDEKEFFQTFITVDAIGPMKAVKAMVQPASEIALAIEQKDVSYLTKLAGIGKRTAEKIIATLHGKVGKFIGPIPEKADIRPREISLAMQDISLQVEAVLVEQLGHSQASARRMIKEALDRDPAISTPEDLFNEIYQEDRNA